MKRLRILWGSPLPPTRSGIADYATEILPELARNARVRLLCPPGWSPADGPRDLLEKLGEPLAWNAPAPPGWVTLLHMGNNPYHIWVARRLRLGGGVVVLHDSVLHHLLVEEAALEGEWGRLATELFEAYGEAGAALARARTWGFAGRLDPFLFPARSVYLRRSQAVVVHSELARRDVADDCPGLPVSRVPLAVAALPAGDREAWRSRLRGGTDGLLLAHMGFLTRAKGLDVVLRALAAARSLGVEFRLVVVGEGEVEGEFTRSVSAAGLGDRVTQWGYASPADLGGILSAADLGIATRYPTAGETSAAALRFLAAGTPVVVTGCGQFLELPADAAPRIAPGAAGVADLVRIVSRFAADRRLRADAREAAHRAWEEGGHAPATAARALLRALAS
jgi:glycosyltransferase involved in cell wall biosynthesis